MRRRETMAVNKMHRILYQIHTLAIHGTLRINEKKIESAIRAIRGEDYLEPEMRRRRTRIVVRRSDRQ